MKDCSIQLTNHPGDLSRVAQVLGRRGVNIKAIAAISVGGGVAMARILPDDIVVARSALEAANIRFTEGEVHIVLLENKAGAVASVTGRLGDAGVNLEALYVTGITDDLVELAIVSDNPKKAKKVLEEFWCPHETRPVFPKARPATARPVVEGCSPPTPGPRPSGDTRYCLSFATPRARSSAASPVKRWRWLAHPT